MLYNIRMDFYKTLGVTRNVSSDELKKAYKKQAMKHHPDRGGDSKKFQEINEAYETLKDPQKKSHYDRFGSNPGFNPNSNTQTWDFGGGFENNVGDVFEQFFGGGPFRQRQRHQRNRDIVIEAQIDLKDVFTGRDMIASYRLTNGREQSVNLHLPKGVHHNTTIKFPSLGDDYHPNSPRGDLLVRIKIKSNTKWNRDNNNLHCIERVNVFDLITGTKKSIETLDGKNLSITIPKGTQPGTVLSISEQGLPSPGGTHRGNIYLTIQADIPNINDAEILNLIDRIKNAID